MYLGIDFGTTNSAMAVSDGTTVRDVVFADGKTLQKTLFFFPEGDARNLQIGNSAAEAYEDSGADGRLVQSIKRHLAGSLDQLSFGNTTCSLVDLVALFLRFLRKEARTSTGINFEKVILGRPVRFDLDDEKDQRAARRLEQAAYQAGFQKVVFQLEPIAAALAYEQGVDHEHLVLVGDFGGGTSDFAIVRVGPRRGLQDRSKDVLSVSGVPLAGDALDRVIMKTQLLTLFGEHATYSLSPGLPQQPWTPSLLGQICDLHHLAILRNRQNEDYLRRMLVRVSDRTCVERVRDLIFHDLGFSLAREIERVKIGLSKDTTVQLRFHEASINIKRQITRSAFEAGAQSIVDKIADAVDQALKDARVKEKDIRRVFLTGGTSQVPMIRRVFTERFGMQAVKDGNVFSSVAQGMALSWPLLET